MAKTIRNKTKLSLEETYLIETAWEVCNQVGGIYTVIRTKIASIAQKYGQNYLLLGPLINNDVLAEIEEIPKDNSLAFKAVKKLRNMGYEVVYGTWLVIGRPRVILIKPIQDEDKIEKEKHNLYDKFGIDIRIDDDLYNQVIAFSIVSKIFIESFLKANKEGTPTTLHCHEWMSAPAMFYFKRSSKIKTVFTTHATLLGRYLAMNDSDFYNKLPEYHWKERSDHFNITSMVQIERKAAELSDVFTTVSEVTGRECECLLGLKPKLILPNGLNINRFSVLHEVQNLHQSYKEVVHNFIMGHFFPSYTFELDNVLYFFTSGRYEYENKGFDITLEALNILNKRLKEEKSDLTVIMFFITKKSYWSINPEVLESRAIMEEIKKNCDAISKQIERRLFQKAAASDTEFKLPDLNSLIDEYWKLRYRRTLQTWKEASWPIVVTHNLVDDMNDDILNYLRKNRLINSPEDNVKIVYHPDFINPTNPLFGIEYSEFVRACHLGVFPSYYEPWGYTPLESLALGVPTVTSDLSGFGDYMENHNENSKHAGAYIVKRYKKSKEESTKDLAEILYNFTQKSRRSRIDLRNKSEDLAESFDWTKLIQPYLKAYRSAWTGIVKSR